jgi:hypothetical protein
MPIKPGADGETTICFLIYFQPFEAKAHLSKSIYKYLKIQFLPQRKHTMSVGFEVLTVVSVGFPALVRCSSLPHWSGQGSALTDWFLYLKKIPRMQLTHCPDDGGRKYL